MKVAAYAAWLLGLFVAFVALTETLLYFLHRPQESMIERRYGETAAGVADADDRLNRPFIRRRYEIPGTGRSFVAEHTVYGCRSTSTVQAETIRPGKITHAIIGDSFAYGWGVANDATFGAVFAREAGIADRLLVCGNYGAGLGVHVAQLRRLLQAEKSLKTIYLQIFGNDLLNDAVDPDPGRAADDKPLEPLYRLRQFLSRDAIPYTTNYLLLPLYDMVRTWQGGVRNYATRRDHVFFQYGPILRAAALSDADRPLRARRLARYRLAARRFIAMAHSRGISVVAFAIPYAAVVEPATARTAFVDLTGEIDRESVLQYRNFLAEVFSGPGACFLDLATYLEGWKGRNPGRPLFIEKDLHLNEAGNRVVGAFLAERYRHNGCSM